MLVQMTCGDDESDTGQMMGFESWKGRKHCGSLRFSFLVKT